MIDLKRCIIMVTLTQAGIRTEVRAKESLADKGI